jgi:hypothetical protein
MYGAFGEIQQVAGFKDHVQYGLADVFVCEVAAGVSGQLLSLGAGAVEAPVLLALQLQDERFNVIVVGREALGARGGQVPGRKEMTYIGL